MIMFGGIYKFVEDLSFALIVIHLKNHMKMKRFTLSLLMTLVLIALQSFDARSTNALPVAPAETGGALYISTDVSSLTFGPTYTGYASSAVITVTGNVSENIELSWWYNREGFGLSKYTITPQEAALGAEVTVYFQPSWTSITNNRLQIKSKGVETITIPVWGTKIKSDGYIHAPSSLGFSTEVGKPVTKTFKLSYTVSNGNDAIMISSVDADDETGLGRGINGTMLNSPKTIVDSLGNLDSRDSIKKFNWDKFKPILILDSLELIYLKGLNLTVTGDNCFTVSPRRVSMKDAKEGCYVTVTFDPEGMGPHEATIKITLFGGSAKPMTVGLFGLAADRNVDPLLGDVNASGQVDISDVTALIDILVNSSEPDARADVNGDAQVNISDVTALLELLK